MTVYPKAIKDFLEAYPETTLDYIQFQELCIRRRAKLAFEEGISLEEYEKKLNEGLQFMAKHKEEKKSMKACDKKDMMHEKMSMKKGMKKHEKKKGK